MTLPEKNTFNYSVVSQEQAMQLQMISTRLKVRVERTAEEMLAMGADLEEARKVCKEDGKTFESWCGSSECPVSWATAKRLMAITAELGNKKDHSDLFRQSFMVLAHATQTRDEDIRQALLEHIEQESEKGKQITQQEITALKKALTAEQERIKSLENEVFDARSLIKGYMAERDEAKIERDRAIDSRDKAIHELIEKDSAMKQKDFVIRAKIEELQDAEAVYKEQLEEMRRRIITEERNRPKTDAEVEQQQRALAALKDEEASIKRQKLALGKEVRDLEEERDGLVKQQTLWTKIVTDFYASAIRFHQETAMLIGTAQALKDIPITSELHSQIHTVIQDADKVSDVLRNAISI